MGETIAAAKRTLHPLSSPAPTAPVAPSNKAASPPGVIVTPPASRIVVPGLPVETATAADHALISQFLAEAYPPAARETFWASLDAPHYEPSDRLLIRSGPRIAAHAQLIRRSFLFEGLLLPVTELTGLVVHPEFRGRGLGQAMLMAVDRQLERDGALIARLTTRIPHFFRPMGWGLCGALGVTRVHPRNLLASLAPRPAADAPAYVIRPWRHVELDALMALYQRLAAPRLGAYERTESYWRWLVSHRHFEQIYVASEAPPAGDAVESMPILGYAVTSEMGVLELVADEAQPTVARELLARACRDALERDDSALDVHAAPGDLADMLCREAACDTETRPSEVTLAKLPSPRRLLHQLGPVIRARAAAMKLKPPCELGILVEGIKYRLVLTRRRVQVLDEKLGRNYLTMSEPDFTRLVMGQINIDEAVARQRIEASNRTALATAKIMFPPRPFGRPPLDQGS